MPGVIAFVPSTAAPTHAGRFRVSPAHLLGLGGNAGGAFLPDVFGAAGRQIVEAAFGADPEGDPGAWVWTDITRHVQWNPGVTTTIGYTSAETTKLTPASFTADLRNDQTGGGTYTLGNANSVLYPYVRENVPIRASLDVGTGTFVRFAGYATGWSPRRGPGGERFVRLLANGVSRRLGQRAGAKRSPMRRAYDYAAVQPVGYWPLEDGRGSTVSYDVIGNAPSQTGGFGALSVDDAGATTFGTATLGDGSALVANIAGGWNLDLNLPYGVVATGTAALEFSLNAGTTVRSGTNMTCGLRLNPYLAARHLAFTVHLTDAGAVELKWYEQDAAFTTLAGPTTIYSAGSENIFDGAPRMLQLLLVASGGTNVAWSLYENDALLSSGTISPSFAGAMNAPPWRSMSLSTAAANSTAAIGHVGVWNMDPGRGRYAALLGHRSETPTARLLRTCAEQNISIDIIGDSDMPMGPQPIATITEILDDAVRADQGLLYDGLTFGYTYVARTSLYSTAPALTLVSGSIGDLVGKVEGEHSDRDRVNDFTATNGDGLSRRHVREDGDLGTAMVGTYDDGGEYNVDGIDALAQMAAWRTGQGTVPGLRWPRLTFVLTKPATSTKATAWLACTPGVRIDVDGIDLGTNPDRSLMLRGWTETWNSKIFDVRANLAPFDAYAVSTFAEDDGDGDEFLGWLEVDMVTTRADLAAGGTSVEVDVTGTVLTNPAAPDYADDIDGLYINLDGLRVGVTGIAGTASPQTISVTGADVTRAVPAGSSVSAWNPAMIGL